MKIDLHNHSYWSGDGLSSPEKLIKEALKKGLDGIAITDHDTIDGWPEAIEASKKLNALLVLGQEINTEKGDLLGLFLAKKVESRKFLEAAKEIRQQGGVAILPHPFHFPENFQGKIKDVAKDIDGIEVFNSRGPITLFDRMALVAAKDNGLAMTGGSDTHVHNTCGNAYAEADAKTLEEFKTALLERRTKITGKKSPIFYLIIPTMARTLRRVFGDKRKRK